MAVEREEKQIEDVWWRVFFIQWNINIRGLFNAKDNLTEKLQWYYLIHSWRDREVHAFPKDVSPKMNEIEPLEFELAYLEPAIQRVSYYNTAAP